MRSRWGLWDTACICAISTVKVMMIQMRCMLPSFKRVQAVVLCLLQSVPEGFARTFIINRNECMQGSFVRAIVRSGYQVSVEALSSNPQVSAAEACLI